MATTITQDMRYRLSLIQYADRFGVSKAAVKYKTNRQYIYRWKHRYDGSIESLRALSRRPHAYPVRQPPEGKAGAKEIVEFPGAVKGRGVEIDVIVNMIFVGMGADQKLIFALRPAHRRFRAQLVCLLRRHLAGRERLPDLKNNAPRRAVTAWYSLFTSRNSAAAVDGSQRWEDTAPNF